MKCDLFPRVRRDAAFAEVESPMLETSARGGESGGVVEALTIHRAPEKVFGVGYSSR